MLRKWAGFGLLALAPVASAWLGACGTDAVGVETCRQIEEARCRQAPRCSAIDLSNPKHRDPDVDACIRFYRDACLHGLVTTSDPGAVQTKACVDAITNGDCNVVEKPESHPACTWLVPPQPAPVDAAAAAQDAAADTTADAAPSDAGLGFDLGLPLGQ